MDVESVVGEIAKLVRTGEGEEGGNGEQAAIRALVSQFGLRDVGEREEGGEGKEEAERDDQG